MTASDDRDLELWIHPPDRQSEPADVSVHVRPDDRRGRGEFRSPFTPEEVDEALGWMEQGLFDDDFVKEFGGKLFAALFAGQVEQLYRASRTDGGDLRIRLVVDDPAAARIPWELLYDGQEDAFLALQQPVVRGMSVAEPARPLEADAPLRILVLDAFPRGVLRVQGQIEAEGIRRALASLTRSRRVEVRTLPHATLAGLQNALREGDDPEKPAPIHVVHFIGHARHDRRADRTVLLFEDEKGEIDEVDPQALVNVLSASDVRLVFLNACQTVHLTALDATRAFAPALLRSGVPAVIGMQVVVLDDVAAQFALEFYEALADNRPVDAAVLDARRLLRSDRARRKADMGVPVCYLRSASGQIVKLRRPAQVPLTLGTWREWARQHSTPRALVGALATTVGLVTGLIAIFQFVVPPPPPPPMSGDFNIAVAEFAARGGPDRVEPSDEASALARSVYDTLEAELADLHGFQIDVRPPDLTGRLPGATPDARAAAAAALADEINADVVVYGTLSAEGTAFEPEFFVSERKLVDAQELAGQYRLGTALEVAADISTNPVARRLLRDRLLERTQALAEFVLGLSYFVNGEYEDAERHLATAAATEGWDDADGKEVAYLFLGTARGKQDELDDARSAYERALALNPEYARAVYGLAEVRFQESNGTGCEAGTIDEAGLREAMEGYRAALAATDQPPRAEIPVVVHLGLGRVFVCLSQALVEDRWAEAEAEFRAVIEEFEGGKEHLAELAAEAYGGLALALLPPEDDPDPAAYRSAAESYARAVELSVRDERREVFELQLDFACGRLEALGVEEDSCDERAA
ncbi:MAG TPA: CHAT domain-containing protein [Candidatus Limnocylindria bacterium]|nr:CHAT domain-containing protein [Candidatus Limnocylindria bacterium]